MSRIRYAVGGLVLTLAATGAWLGLGPVGSPGGPSIAAAQTLPGSAGVGPMPVRESEFALPVGAEPDGTAVTLDVTLARPTPTGTDAGVQPGVASRWPVVLLAHGFGGSKADLLERGRALAARGYLAVSYSARGFGDSGGRIHLDDPAFEVADARALVDRVATETDALLDAPGDPRLAVLGASYGGALALMLGSSDPRVDSVVASVTWNDLAEAFFPQHASAVAVGETAAAVTPTSTVGVLRQLWASRFFGSGVATPSAAGGAPLCGRMDPSVCEPFLAAVESGTPSPQLLDLLRAHSPAPSLSGLRASTLLVQGMRDTLFGLDQADATARALAGRVPRLGVRWIDGGHDGPSSTAAADEQAVDDWLADTLGGPSGSKVAAGSGDFVYAATIPRRQSVAPLVGIQHYPGVATWTSVPFASSGSGTGGSAERTVATPPGGQPASVTTLPGAGALVGGAAAYQLAALPGQSAAFDTVPLEQRTTIAGAPRVTLTVTSTGTEVVLFLGLWQVTADAATLPRRLVAPVRIVTVPGRPTTVEVALAPATWTVEAGSRLRVLVTSTDSAYAAPRTARVDQLAVTGAGLRLPNLPGTVVAHESDVDTESIGVAGVILVLLAVLVSAAWVERRRRRHLPHRPELRGIPLVVEGLAKAYPDGHRAVDGVSWRAERGQVVGLLGPNGAGKTTTLRMVLGLVAPDAGACYVGGEPIRPGSPALAGVGALVEGPGFLPHLTGVDNLRAYWAATGRPESEAGFADALEVAALGDAVDRPVRSYSHGMRQRLGIAQAMLGRPDLLVLDEPTNGLDPPQIAAMRPILQRYAASGRTVVVSSHLLAEVEQTCSHVVVMHAGRVVTAGAVADLVDSPTTTVAALDPAATPAQVAAVAERVADQPGIEAVEVVADEGEPRLVVTSSLPRADVVRALTRAGADVVGVSSRRHLEEVFLGVIAAARRGGTPDHHGPDDAHDASGERGSPESVTEALRRVRAR
jgi:ABC-2 type transport system ATP-binding protein